VAHQDQLSTAIDHGFDRRQRHFDATVVCDFQVVVQRDVKVDSHENGFGCDVDIVDVFLGHANDWSAKDWRKPVF